MSGQFLAWLTFTGPGTDPESIAARQHLIIGVFSDEGKASKATENAIEGLLEIEYSDYENLERYVREISVDEELLFSNERDSGLF
jgi:hypothetical protein